MTCEPWEDSDQSTQTEYSDQRLGYTHAEVLRFWLAWIT